MIARDDFAVLTFVVAKAPYSHKNDRYILALLQTRIWSNVEKYPDLVNKLFTQQNIVNLQDFGFTLDFGFQIVILSSRIHASA